MLEEFKRSSGFKTKHYIKKAKKTPLKKPTPTKTIKQTTPPKNPLTKSNLITCKILD